MSDALKSHPDGTPRKPLPWSNGPGPNDYDALADLFLSDLPQRTLRLAADDAPAAAVPLPPISPAQEVLPAPVSVGEVHVEAMIVGHLPVLASAWISQYAKHQAEQLREQVALLRVSGGHATLDLIQPRVSAAASQSRVGQAPAAPYNDIEQAIRDCSRKTSRWLIRVDEHDEPELFRSASIASLTLLTGADEAAVVASYRTIKRICSLPHDDDSPQPALRIAIMGSDDATAHAAEEKIRRAASAFLDRTIELAATVSKISGSSTINVFRGETQLSTRQVLELVNGASQCSKQAAKPDAPPIQPSIAPLQQAADAQTPPNSIAHILPDGLLPVMQSCPYARGVTIASDTSGSVHLVARATGADAVGELLAAAAWVSDHAELLSKAYPAIARAAESPTLHVVTDSPKLVRGLLDTAVRVHLVCTVRTGNGLVSAMSLLN